jgi:uncharacterized protein YcfJ
MNTLLKSALAAAGLALATQAAAQVTLYEHNNFAGRAVTAQKQVKNFKSVGFNDRASSVLVSSGRWEVCEDTQFRGRCVVLRRGQYPSLAAMGLNDRVSSARSVGNNARVDNNRYAPYPVVDRDYRRRNNERLYEAEVTSVRAVVGPPEQRCWIEREQVSVQQERGPLNVPGAVVGAVIGGILGHQVGNGRGQDIATVGGAVAGGAIGANVNRGGGGQTVQTQDVQKCATVPGQARADLWDVSYTFRGQPHRVQMTNAPGRTVTVNGQGEPRA